MKKSTYAELNEIVDKHQKWLRCEDGGERANLTGADLAGINLKRANLARANLTRADLIGADLVGAILIGANLAEANLARANLTRADLIGADLTETNLSEANLEDAILIGANLAEANLARANLTRADLIGADLTETNLSEANLEDAILIGASLIRTNLAGANLKGTSGIVPERCNPLLMLYDQPGPIRAYKLVDKTNEGIYNGGLKYEIGETVEVDEVDTDVNELCGAGINLATLDWCLQILQLWGQGKQGYKILICEFCAEDIVAIPTASAGKFRVKRCKVIGEKDLSDLF